jgi:hypothetical protein
MASAIVNAAQMAWRADWYLVVAAYAAAAWMLSLFYGFDLALGIYRLTWLSFPIVVNEVGAAE